jgi:Cysteine sulfinate desulfinase/cysteine desulfurase and related enzymes
MAIYLDYSATTPTRPEVIAEMTQVLQSEWGNPASIHRWGERALLVMERARQKVAELINADPEGIVFTSGGTESNNTAIMAIARQYLTPQHIIISAIEHSAISQPVNYLESLGWQVTRLPVDREGRVSPHTLAQALQATQS